MSVRGQVAGRLREQLTAFAGRPLKPDERLAIAVSGGADSLALLLLAVDVRGRNVVALTVDHGLRAGTDQEAAQVGRVATSLGIEHATLRWTGEKPDANVQAAAREARYRLLSEWCRSNAVQWLATAHHADDQAETLLLRLGRGAGLTGLSGIRAWRALGHGVTLVRPLLTERHVDLVAICAEAGLEPMDDPTNRSERYDRTKARALLQQADWLDSGRIARSAGNLAEAAAALDWAVDLAWESRVCRDGAELIVDAGGLPREIARRLLDRALAEVGDPGEVRGGQIANLLDRLMTGEDGALGRVSVRQVNAVGGSSAGVWRLAREMRSRVPSERDRIAAGSIVLP